MKNADDPSAKALELEKDYREKFANPFVAAKKGYIDDVIEPQNLRFRVIKALEMIKDKKAKLPFKKHGNIPL